MTDITENITKLFTDAGISQETASESAQILMAKTPNQEGLEKVGRTVDIAIEQDEDMAFLQKLITLLPEENVDIIADIIGNQLEDLENSMDGLDLHFDQ